MKKLIIIFIASRLIILLSAFCGPFFIKEFGYKFPYTEILQDYNLPYWLWSFGNFDGVHYLWIVKVGYAWGGTQAFFPLYPIVVKLVSLFTFNNHLIAALLVSNIAFFICVTIFYKLLVQKYDKSISYWSCVFMLFFPTSFYFSAIYTESLFLMLVILAFYLMEKEKVLLASTLGLFASSTRLIGVLLLPSLFNFKKAKKSIYLFIIPFGLLVYMLYLQIEFHNPLYFLTAQNAFGQERSSNQIILLPQVFYRYIKIFITTSGTPLANAFAEFLSTVFALVTLFLAYKKKIKQEWIIFSFLSVILPTLTGTLTSMPRYILLAFPIFIYLGMIKSNLIKYLILLLFLVLLIPCVIIFTRGYWLA